MKENAALFPFDKNELPIARHFGSLQNVYELKNVIAWNGCGGVGKDAAFLCNQPAIDVTVMDQLTENDSEWNTLIVDCASINTALKSSGDMEGLFRKWLEKDKRIVLVTDNASCCKYDDVLREEYPDKVCCLNGGVSVGRNHFSSIKYAPLSTPVLLVGGLVKTEDTLEIALSLKEQFDNHNRKVSCITSSNLGVLFGCHSYNHIFENSNCSEEEKILELNQLARDIVEAERPELIIIEAPDAVMKFRNVAPNGFGIRTHMVIQALSPDFFVCSMPNSLADTTFVNHLSQGLLKRFGFTISAAHVCNVVVDSSSVIQEQSLSYLYIDMNEVQGTLQNKTQQDSIYICNTVLQGSNGLFSRISKLIERGA